MDVYRMACGGMVKVKLAPRRARKICDTDVAALQLAVAQGGRLSIASVRMARSGSSHVRSVTTSTPSYPTLRFWSQ